MVDPTAGGLNILWRTDVNSKQENYLLVYTRNDTGRSTKLQTSKKAASLEDFYPGAGYTLKVHNIKQKYFINEELLS